MKVKLNRNIFFRGAMLEAGQVYDFDQIKGVNVDYYKKVGERNVKVAKKTPAKKSVKKTIKKKK